MDFRFLIGILLLGTMTTQAQFGGMNGMNRNRGQMPMATPQDNKEKKPVDYVQLTTDQLEKSLTLDGFQKAVIKDIIADYFHVAMAVSAEDLPAEGKNDKIKAASDKMDKKILEILTPAQIKKYSEMKEAKAKGKKKKGKKKDADPQTDNPLDDPLSEN